MEKTIKLHTVDPDEFPADWASDWGHDAAGYWMAMTVYDVRYCFRWIRPGEFLMGSPEDEPERFDREQQHKVTLTRGFWLGETACTQALWEAVMGANPGYFKGKERPVETVSWDDCMTFIERLNKMKSGLELRLPTEAEWEYSCRAGTTTPFSFGRNITTDQVNYNGERPYAGSEKGKDRGETVDVRSLPPNPWGLYEMHGNVLEWCSDWLWEYPDGDVVDPQGPETCGLRVLRGGSFLGFGGIVRSACRFRRGPGILSRSIGFRLARGQKAGGAGK